MVFEYLNPVFITLILFLLIFLILVLMKSRIKAINGLFVVSISIICLTIGSILTWQEGLIYDELNLTGGSSSFGMFLIIAALSFVNPVIFALKK
jgi:hypothetical protein